MQKPFADNARAKLSRDERRVLQVQDQQVRESICARLGIRYWHEASEDQLRTYTTRSKAERYVIEHRLWNRFHRQKSTNDLSILRSVASRRPQGFSVDVRLKLVQMVYLDSNAKSSRALYRQLQKLGHQGTLAANLLRLQKSSDRAKSYGNCKRGRFRGYAYDRKGTLLSQLCEQLAELDFCWGWAIDESANRFSNVLYLDLPTGQVSWHSELRFNGPDYPGEWDGMVGMSPSRTIEFSQSLIDASPNNE